MWSCWWFRQFVCYNRRLRSVCYSVRWWSIWSISDNCVNPYSLYDPSTAEQIRSIAFNTQRKRRGVVGCHAFTTTLLWFSTFNFHRRHHFVVLPATVFLPHRLILAFNGGCEVRMLDTWADWRSPVETTKMVGCLCLCTMSTAAMCKRKGRIMTELRKLLIWQ